MPALSELKKHSPRWLLTAADASTRGLGLASSGARPLPDFLVVGTKRGGTTSLFNYLIRHPGILGLFPQPRGKKSTDYFFANNHRSLNWYRSHFHTEPYRRMLQAQLGYRPLSFEASPYYLWDPRIADWVAKAAPQMKAIVLLRDPVRRAWSHYQERVQNDVEPLSFPAALAAEEARLDGVVEQLRQDPTFHSDAWDWYSYRARGDYLPQLQNWHASFPREQLLVLRAEDLYRDTQATVDRICVFLGVPTHRLVTTKPFNATWRTREEAPEQASAQLREYYAAKQPALEAYLGEPIGW